MELAQQATDELAEGTGSTARVAELEAHVAELWEQGHGLEARRVQAEQALCKEKHGE